MKQRRRRSSDRNPASARRREPVTETREKSPTAVATEALRKGVLPGSRVRPAAIPHEDEMIRVGDPDDDSLQNEYSGEDTPGGSTPTPDQSNIDEIGRVYGLQEEDSGRPPGRRRDPEAARSAPA